MGIVFNGVLASRLTGSLMPSSPLNTLKISDCSMSAIKIDQGDQQISRDLMGEQHQEEIVSNPKNLPEKYDGDWSFETQVYANFDGDLEAGPLAFYGKEITGLAIRRSSNRSQFSIWEDVKIVPKIKSSVNAIQSYSLIDKTVESGVWYRYAIQPIASHERGSLHKSLERAVIFEDAYLVGQYGKQLCVRYDFSTSGIRKNIKEARVETIGSKYPFITRNADVNYREFQLSGLITHFMDDHKDFAPRATMFLDEDFTGTVDVVGTEKLYNALYLNNGINDYNNTTLEREFRNKVHDFLTDGEPKLFKCPKVGNVLVRLMDVNLASREDINGGMVYTFSCNAIEVDKASVENFDKYNIQLR